MPVPVLATAGSSWRGCPNRSVAGRRSALAASVAFETMQVLARNPGLPVCKRRVGRGVERRERGGAGRAAIVEVIINRKTWYPVRCDAQQRSDIAPYDVVLNRDRGRAIGLEVPKADTRSDRLVDRIARDADHVAVGQVDCTVGIGIDQIARNDGVAVVAG